ncbi:dynamin family protein, partial [Treponema phagedenis]|uniref:dynamin family protein n=2 Tax=Treponema phagedenis TaxID=162 RepID=UPI0018DEE0E1
FMELESKARFNTCLTEMLGIEQDAELDTSSTQDIQTAVNTGKLLVPVVGEFSAGKSSLLNKFMGKNVLSVGINPETAIPSELYFSESEYCEGVTRDGTVTRLNDDSDITNYVCLRRYIKSDALKKLEPIVLVDMPGFDSPLDAHNKAIFNYLDRGVHYVVLTPVDAGTVSASMQKQIQNILTFGRECSFFISKTDLRSSDEVAAVKNELQNEVSMLTGKTETVFEINKDDVSLFNNFVSSLNPNALFQKVFTKPIQDECFAIKSSINTKIATLKKDKASNQKAVDELKAALTKIEEKKNKLIANESRNTYIGEADIVANAVGSALQSNLESLTSIAMNGGKEALNEEINSIVQNTIASKINDVMIKITTRFTGEFSKSVDGLQDVFDAYNNDEFMRTLQDSARDLFDVTQTSISQFLENKKNTSKTDTGTILATAAAGAFGILTNVLAPIVEILIVLLPTIFSSIFSRTKEDQKRQEVSSAISAQIPTIKREVRTHISQVLQDNSKHIIEAISEKYDAELAKKKEEIEQAQKELESNNQINEMLQKLESCLNRTDKVLSQIM